MYTKNSLQVETIRNRKPEKCAFAIATLITTALFALMCMLLPAHAQIAYADELQTGELKTQDASGLSSGDLVYFGSYFQDIVKDDSVVEAMNESSPENISGKNCWEISGVRYTTARHEADDGNTYWYAFGEAPLRWYVLDSTGNSYTLISEKVIDTHEFYNIHDGLDLFWGDSTVRRWLNSDFIDLAFTADEQQDMVTSSILHDTAGGGYPYGSGVEPDFVATNDKVYLIDGFEIDAGVFSNSGVPVLAKATSYVDMKENYASYWLRGGCAWSYGNLYAAGIADNGAIETFIPTAGRGIRPVIRVHKDAAGLSVEKPAGYGGTGEDSSRLALKSAIYHYGTETSAKEVDVLHKAHSIEPDHAPFDLTVKCVSNKAQLFMLFSGKKKIAESVTGEFKGIDPSEFKEMEEVSVLVKGQTESLKTPLLLEIKDKSLVVPESVSLLGSGFSITLNDDIPIVGGRTVSFDLPSFPVSAVVEDGKLKIGINIKKENLYSASKYTNDPDAGWDVTTSTYKRKSIAEQMESWRTNMYKSSNIMKDMKGYMANGDLAADIPFAEKSASVSLMGYFETAWSDRLDKVSGQLILMVNGSKTWQSQFLAPIIEIPMTFNITASGKLANSLKGQVNLSSDPFLSGEFTGTLGGSLEPYLGVGVGQWISAGVYGNLGCSTSAVFLSSTESSGVKKFTLSGEVGAKAYFAMKEGKITLLSMKDLAKTKFGPFIDGDELLLWTHDGKGAVNKLFGKKTGANSALSIQSDYYENPDSYFEPVKLGAPARNASASGDNVLVDNVYPAAAPQLATVGGRTVVAYVDVDSSRAEADRSVLKYAIYDSASGVLGEAMPVDDDGTADMQPVFYRDGDDLYVCYLNSRQVFGDGVDPELSDYATTFGVSVAKFDADQGEFVGLGSPDNNGLYCYAPAISKAYGGLQCVWVENSEGSVFGVGGTNSVCYSVYSDGEWSEPEVLADDVSCVTGTACGTLDNEDAIAYIVDDDNDLTTPESTLYLACGGDYPEEQARGDVACLTFGLFGEEPVLAYCEGGAPMLLRSGDDSAEEIAQEGTVDATRAFELHDGAFYFLQTTNGSRNVMKLDLGENSLSAVPLTRESGYVDSFSADGDKLLYLRSEVDVNSEDLDSSSQIKLLDETETHDLVIGAALFNHEQVEPGNALEMALDITNNGTVSVGEIEVGLRKVGDSEMMATDTLYTSLAPGDALEEAAEFWLPEDFEAGEYEVVVSEPGCEDASEEDNITVVDFGKADISVEASYAVEEDGHYFVSEVSNTGLISSQVIATIRDEDGNELDHNEDVLGPGEVKTYRYLIDEELLGGESGSVLTAVVESDGDEYFESNNADAVRVWDIQLSDPVEISNGPADEVAGLIAELPNLSDLTVADQALVEEAKRLYDSLTDEQKMLAGDAFAQLQKAESRIAALKKAAPKAKANNTLSVKAKSKQLTVKYKKLKKKAQTIKPSKAFVVTGAKGAVTFVKLSGHKKISVSRAGKITIKKKGLKKGKTYRVKVMVIAAGNAYYKPTTRNVTIKIKVK